VLKTIKKKVMKKYKNNMELRFLQRCCIAVVLLLCINTGSVVAQDSAKTTSVKKVKPVKGTFASTLFLDDQTVMVPIKGTFEFDMQHRFGTVNEGSKNLWGIYGPANIRLAVGYSPMNKLYIGAGITKEKMQVDFNAKYALLLQTTDNKMPVSVTVFGNMAIDTRKTSDFINDVDRLSYFSEIMVARKITDKFSAQIAPTFTWFNNVEAYVDSKGDIQPKMENGQFAISLIGRYKVTEKGAITLGYNQPLTQNTTNNPHPNISFGYEVTTSNHAFQLFMGNYFGILPQYNNMYNQNDYTEGQFLIGFNITKLWNF
jgi:Membrane bound beta barrel domain (DUF5777)